MSLEVTNLKSQLPPGVIELTHLYLDYNGDSPAGTNFKHIF